MQINRNKIRHEFVMRSQGQRTRPTSHWIELRQLRVLQLQHRTRTKSDGIQILCCCSSYDAMKSPWSALGDEWTRNPSAHKSRRRVVLLCGLHEGTLRQVDIWSSAFRGAPVQLRSLADARAPHVHIHTHNDVRCRRPQSSCDLSPRGEFTSTSVGEHGNISLICDAGRRHRKSPTWHSVHACARQPHSHPSFAAQIAQFGR